MQREEGALAASESKPCTAVETPRGLTLPFDHPQLDPFLPEVVPTRAVPSHIGPEKRARSTLGRQLPFEVSLRLKSRVYYSTTLGRVRWTVDGRPFHTCRWRWRSAQGELSRKLYRRHSTRMKGSCIQERRLLLSCVMVPAA